MALLHEACPRCRFPRLSEQQGTYEYQYAGEMIRLGGIEFCVCPHCAYQLILDVQQERNRQRISDANLEALASKWAATRTVELPPPAPAPTPADDATDHRVRLPAVC